jgi:hypothetical protein
MQRGATKIFGLIELDKWGSCQVTAPICQTCTTQLQVSCHPSCPNIKDWFLPRLRIAISLWSIGTWSLPRHTNSNDIMDFSHASHRKPSILWKNLAVCCMVVKKS